MKKILLIAAFSFATLLNAQDNWTNLVPDGLGATLKFNQLKTFQGKMYTGGYDAAAAIQLYSTSTGNAGSYSHEPGLNTVLQGSHEKMMSAVTADNTYMFMGTGVDTVTYNPAFFPAVYRFDGSTYTKHGSIPFDTTGVDSLILNTGAYINTLALYSPTGSNDSIYAFGSSSFPPTGLTVWKAPANITNPTWVNAGRFSISSGISQAFDAIVWHKKLYVAVNSTSTLGGYILRTADGINWDTVVTAMDVLSPLGGQPPFWNNFTAFEIFNDTLVAGLTESTYALWYTTDSLATTQTWNYLYNGANYSNFYWDYITDLQVIGNRIWVEAEDYSSQLRVSGRAKNPSQHSIGYVPAIAQFTHADSLTFSSGGTDIENYNNNGIDFKLAYFNGEIYTAGNAAAPFNTYTDGEVWKLVNPIAGFYLNPAVVCTNTIDSLKNTSLNSQSGRWYLDGSYYASSWEASLFFAGPGAHSVKLRAYSGTGGTGIYDTLTYNFNVFSNTVIDSVVAVLDTVCQGQPDTVRTYVQGGLPPYTYQYFDQQSTQVYTTGNPGVIVPVNMPFANYNPIVTDANGCINTSGFLSIKVNGGDSLSGTVIDTLLNPVNAGKVYMFKLNPLNPNTGDTTGFINLNAAGSYYFSSVYYGDYIVKAIADTSNSLYATAVGTYYSNKTYPFQWDSALVIQHHACTNGNNAGNNIKILQMPGVSAGPGTINGQITKGPGYGIR